MSADRKWLQPKYIVVAAIVSLALGGALSARWYFCDSSLYTKATHYVKLNPVLTREIGDIDEVYLPWNGRVKFDWIEHGLKARMWLIAETSEGNEYRVYFYGGDSSSDGLSVYRSYAEIDGRRVVLKQ